MDYIQSLIRRTYGILNDPRSILGSSLNETYRLLYPNRVEKWGYKLRRFLVVGPILFFATGLVYYFAAWGYFSLLFQGRIRRG